MQKQPSGHWSPFSASWIVAMGLILLAALPHQIPAIYIFRTWVGSAAWLLLSGFVFYQIPYLGIAMMMFLVGAWTWSVEGFNPPTLNKDPVTSKNRWFDESVLHEEPHQIQELTESSVINVDTVEGDALRPWQSERMLDQHTVAIQDRTSH
jgi:hypothetical protein